MDDLGMIDVAAGKAATADLKLRKGERSHHPAHEFRMDAEHTGHGGSKGLSVELRAVPHGGADR